MEPKAEVFYIKDMSFRKRNIGLVHASSRTPQGRSPGDPERSSPQTIGAIGTQCSPGVRPSPVDGRPTTSTGTQTLDGVLAGHHGLALGNSLLIEESGATDYAGTLLRYYASEGVVQGHRVHVVGVGEQWGRDLPGLAGIAPSSEDKETTPSRDEEKMKIAWRYEKLGEFGAGAANARGGIFLYPRCVQYVDCSMNVVHKCATFSLMS